MDRLQEEIRSFFSKLSSSRSHLAHLASVSLKVLDWNDLRTSLMQHPQMLLRWFPRTRPIGLVPIDDFSEIGSFRSYLYSDVLPYYDRHGHLRLVPAPPDSALPDEQQLLLGLRDSDITGLIITGKGGVGKTRLTLEVGRLARRQGWLVLRCRGNLSADTVVQLAELVSTKDQVLIVADYIEVQREFNEFVEALIALNDTYDLHIRYVANCRASFYRSLAFLPSHAQLNLSPVFNEGEALWVQGFQKEVVRHILESSDLAIAQEHLLVCRNRPVFAVFMSYLHRSGRSEELAELSGEQDFSRWVARRLQLTFGEAATTRRLAELMVMFPLPDESLHHYDLRDSVPILERLAADGWMEKPSATYKGDQMMWVVAHDVLADQIVLSYLDSTPDTVQLFMQGALAGAMRVGSFRSALLTMQRIADQAALEHVDWFEILMRHLSEEKSLPRSRDRTTLVRTSLLTPLERIRLLGANEDFWGGAEQQADFQNAIGWLARWAQSDGQLTADDGNGTTLVRWLGRAAPFASESNYMLSSGLRFCPEAVREASFTWISTRPLEHQTHYLIVAWLENGQPPNDIELAVWQWTTHFMYSRQLSFVAASWLQAEGDPQLIRESIFAWLEEFGSQPEAHFIYRAWLDAGGDLELIQAHLNGWFLQNAVGPGAASVYVCWLRNRKPPEGLADHIVRWLAVHGDKLNAASVYRAWLTKGGEMAVVAGHIERWLKLWGTEHRAEPIYSAWLRAHGSWETVAQHIKAWLLLNEGEVKAGFIYQIWLSHGGDKEWAKPYVTRWIQRYGTEPVAERVYTAWLYVYGEHDFIVASLSAWLKKHAERISADFVFKAWLETGGALSLISPHLTAWLEVNWESPNFSYFVKFLLYKDPSVPAAIEILLSLCVNKPESENSLQCLAQIIDKPHGSPTDRAALAACSVVLGKLFDSRSFPSKKLPRLMTELMGLLLTRPHFNNGEYRAQINALFILWLKNVSTADVKLHTARRGQRPEYLHRIRELVSAGALMLDEDGKLIKSVLHWINGWSPRIKAELKEDLEYLSANYPAPRLWDTVNVESKVEPQKQVDEPSDFGTV